MRLDLSKFNENQKRAVEWQDGPLLVLAGPGSGKTRVLTYRIARLIEESADKRYKILGLTFTNKAAGEMRDRIVQLVPDAGVRTSLTTFHSFCADLLRQHGHHLGLRPDFTILVQESEREAILEDVIETMNAAGQYNAQRLLPLIARLLDQNVHPESAEDLLRKHGLDDAEKIARIYSAYRKNLINRNCLDFGSLIAEAIVLLDSKSGIRRQIQRIYPYICVDEFQDTNYSQYQVLHYIVNHETKNLFVVADDDQIIYQWNGANPKRLEALRKEFSMKVIQLPENYRCPPEVIDIANKLIVNNLGRSADKEMLRAHKVSNGKMQVRVFNFKDLENEAAWVAEDIAAKSLKDRAKCAILSRTRKVLEVFIRELEAVGLSGFLSVRKDEFVTAPLQWLHAMLRLANARQDREQVRRVCKAFFTLEGINLNVRDIISIAATTEGDYLRAWQKEALQRAELEVMTRKFIKQTVNALVNQLDFRRFIIGAFQWFDSIDYIGTATDDQMEEYREEKKVWEDITNDVEAQYGSDNITLHLLLQEFDLRSKTSPPPVGAIPCFTIHASKGLEFGHVYLVALVEDQLPSWAAIKKGNNSHEMQEERRNCFVAVTRAQESLTLTYSDTLFGWHKNPSRFLREMGLLTG